MPESILRRCPHPEGFSYSRLVIVDATGCIFITGLTSPHPAQEPYPLEVDPKTCEQRRQSNQCPRGIIIIPSP